MSPMRTSIALLILALSLPAAEPWTAVPMGTTDAPYGYLEHLPPDYRKHPKGRHPLVFFLHGLGELGDSAKDLAKVGKYGPLKLLADGDPVGRTIDQQSAIVIAPQGLKADKWWRTEKLTATLEAILKRHPIDPARIYVTGLSMGGGGTWAVATALPGRIAAIVPICGAARAGDAKKLRGLPIWAHHAINDPVVKFPDNTQTWFDGILKDVALVPAGGLLATRTATDKPWTGYLTPKGWLGQEGIAPPGPSPLILTLHPDGSHDSWTRTYRNPAVWAWLFAQSLKPTR